ncbi:MAG: hypothetical protein LKM35_00535 [Lachnospiraceae bacterium]|jgi:hypothetical protein|nr:hypothetical protein [Lachnospiraceae bacterium]MCI1726167.1 hypothetical protein [Lachnospiraceae bacterium]
MISIIKSADIEYYGIHKEPKPEILSVLSRKTGCTYISDLHFAGADLILKAVSNIPEESYSLSEWADAGNYLTGSRREYKDTAEARMHILEWLEERSGRLYTT